MLANTSNTGATLDVHVGRAGDTGDAVAESLRDRVVAGGVRSDDLQIDRCREAEIQNLIGDVRRLEEEHRVGKGLGQPFATLAICDARSRTARTSGLPSALGRFNVGRDTT